MPAPAARFVPGRRRFRNCTRRPGGRLLRCGGRAEAGAAGGGGWRRVVAGGVGVSPWHRPWHRLYEGI